MDDMNYPLGSRSEMEALISHIETNHRIALSQLAEGDDAHDTLSIGLLFCSMLRQSLQDHFAGRN